MKMEIRKNGDPVLRAGTVKVKNPLDKDVQELILCMIETMRETGNAVGLAAPQVGSNLRLCVIDVDGTQYVLINPKITAKSRQKVVSEEGCLSIPGEFFPISRCSQVQVRYLDEEGAERKLKGTGLLARALQHEIDHLDGILIIDKIKKSKVTKKKLEQTKK